METGVYATILLLEGLLANIVDCSDLVQATELLLLFVDYQVCRSALMRTP